MLKVGLILLGTALVLGGCKYETGPAGQPSRTNVNPETGQTGGH